MTTTTQTRRRYAANTAAYITSIRGRLDLAQTPAEHQAIISDIDAMLSGPGRVTFTDAKIRSLRAIQNRALRAIAS